MLIAKEQHLNSLIKPFFFGNVILHEKLEEIEFGNTAHLADKIAVLPNKSNTVLFSLLRKKR